MTCVLPHTEIGAELDAAALPHTEIGAELDAAAASISGSMPFAATNMALAVYNSCCL